MNERGGVTKKLGPEVSTDEAERLHAASRSTILQSASDALWRTIENEKRYGQEIDPDLTQAHALVRAVIHRWQGGG